MKIKQSTKVLKKAIDFSFFDTVPDFKWEDDFESAFPLSESIKLAHYILNENEYNAVISYAIGVLCGSRLCSETDYSKALNKIKAILYSSLKSCKEVKKTPLQ